MRPLDRYLALNHLIERLSYFSGFNPFVPTWKLNRYRTLYLFYLMLGYLSTFWCMYEADTGVEIVKRAMGLGIFTQSLSKGFLLIGKAEVYQELIEKIKLIYRSKNKRIQEVVIGKVNLCENIYNIISIVNSSAVLIFISYPLISMLFMSQLNLMFPFYIPMLDPHSYPGFITSYLFHSILLINTLMFHNAFDIAFICFTIHAVAMTDLIKIDYDELAELLEKSDVENVPDMINVRQKLKGIIEAQKEFDLYVDKLNELYKWPCFVTSSTSIFSICIALVLILIVRWPQSYGLCWALFGQLFAAYLNGEIINYQYGRLNQYVYNLSWHKFRVSEQKLMILMIQKSQKPNLMDMLFIGTLNLETFSTICNAIYSYYNICESFLKK